MFLNPDLSCTENDVLLTLFLIHLYQIAPAELEHLLLSHPDITNAAVIPYVLISTFKFISPMHTDHFRIILFCFEIVAKFCFDIIIGILMKKQGKYQWPL